MDAMTIAQIANSFIQTVFIVIIGLGYYFTIRTLRGQVQEAFLARATGGRPLIIVSEDYENLPTTNLVVHNVGHGPAKDIKFHFSSPIESSDGFKLSELTIFREGIPSLAPGARIVCYWDELSNLRPLIEEGQLERDTVVTVEYQDITGGNYAHDWEVDPGLYLDLRTQGYKDMDDLVEAVEHVAQEIAEDGARRTQEK